MDLCPLPKDVDRPFRPSCCKARTAGIAFSFWKSTQTVWALGCFHSQALSAPFHISRPSGANRLRRKNRFRCHTISSYPSVSSQST